MEGSDANIGKLFAKNTGKKMPKLIAIILLALSGPTAVISRTGPQEQNPLSRRYREGEKLTYHMKGVNEDWHYEIQATGVVKKDSIGYVEEYGWSGFISNGNALKLPDSAASFRQQLSLDPKRMLAFPNLSLVDPAMIGPVTDFFTFYADLWLAIKTDIVRQPSDHFYFKQGTPNSWADGKYVLLGEDSIDFDVTLKEIDRSDQTVTLLVRHVPPAIPQIKLPAEWMQKPVADTRNNWVQISQRVGDRYIAAVGKESFDVEIKQSMVDGVILSATMDNPLVTVERQCEDAAATKCGDPKPHSLRRQIQITLER
jgi:hypothetical protein